MLRLVLNGAPVALDAPPDRTLAAILREEFGLTGTKIGCAIGRRGACTVLMNGAAVNACPIMAWQAEGRPVTTIEGWRRCLRGAPSRRRWRRRMHSSAAIARRGLRWR